jgi:hypothetical protein
MTVTTESAWTHRFTHNKKQITVSMTAPYSPSDAGKNKIASGTLYLVETPKMKITKPTWGLGVIAEASFVVTGLSFDVSFSIGWTFDARYPERVKNPHTMKDIVITSMTIGTHNGITKDRLEQVPAGKLLSAAMRASAVRVVHYPANYDGPSLAFSGFTTTTSSKGKWEVAGHTSKDVPDGFAKGLTGHTDQFDKDAQLRRVAEIVKASRPNRQTFDVQSTLHCTDRHARRLIQQARDAGYLPPLKPTDKRTRKASQ